VEVSGQGSRSVQSRGTLLVRPDSKARRPGAPPINSVAPEVSVDLASTRGPAGQARRLTVFPEPTRTLRCSSRSQTMWAVQCKGFGKKSVANLAPHITWFTRRLTRLT
jgi:hypothetical protein